MCGLMLDTVAEGKLNHNDLHVLTSDFQREGYQYQDHQYH